MISEIAGNVHPKDCWEGKREQASFLDMRPIKMKKYAVLVEKCNALPDPKPADKKSGGAKNKKN